MAKYTVTHSCGHDAEQDASGTGKERDQRLEWLATTLCPDCYAAQKAPERAQKQAEQEAENAAAAVDNAAAGLPALVGSDKQIAWAETVRKKVLDAVAPVLSCLEAHPEKCEARFASRLFLRYVAWLRIQSKAAWWIDEFGKAEIKGLWRDGDDFSKIHTCLRDLLIGDIGGRLLHWTWTGFGRFSTKYHLKALTAYQDKQIAKLAEESARAHETNEDKIEAAKQRMIKMCRTNINSLYH